MATTQPTLTTADDLLALNDDACRYDLIEGELYRMSPASPRHGAIVHEFSVELGVYLRANPIGQAYAAESGFRLRRDPDTVLGPDAAFVRREKIPPTARQQGFWDVVPDLVAEVISPSDTARYLADKIAAYLEAGVEIVLTIDPDRRTLSVHTSDGVSRTLREADTLELPDLLPGFAMPVSVIFSSLRTEQTT